MKRRIDCYKARFEEVSQAPMTVTHGNREITLNSELSFLYRAMTTLNHEDDFWKLLGMKETATANHRL